MGNDHNTNKAHKGLTAPTTGRYKNDIIHCEAYPLDTPTTAGDPRYYKKWRRIDLDELCDLMKKYRTPPERGITVLLEEARALPEGAPFPVTVKEARLLVRAVLYAMGENHMYDENQPITVWGHVLVLRGL